MLFEMHDMNRRRHKWLCRLKPLQCYLCLFPVGKRRRGWQMSEWRTEEGRGERRRWGGGVGGDRLSKRCLWNDSISEEGAEGQNEGAWRSKCSRLEKWQCLARRKQRCLMFGMLFCKWRVPCKPPQGSKETMHHDNRLWCFSAWLSASRRLSPCKPKILYFAKKKKKS